MAVSEFLTSVGLGFLIEKFTEEEINIEALMEMDEQDLKDIGVDKKGPRLTILAAIRRIKESGETFRTIWDSKLPVKANMTTLGRDDQDIWVPPTESSNSKESDNVRDGERSTLHDCILKDDNKSDSGSGPDNLRSTDITTESSLEEFICVDSDEIIDHTEYSSPDGQVLGNRSPIAEMSGKTITASFQVAALLNRITRLHGKSKEHLLNIYDKILELFKNKPKTKNILRDLIDEMTEEFGYIEYKIQDYKQDISDDSCPIVITGETSAGKSTFVNLLLGADLMPQSSLSCTSTICRIYNRSYKAVFVTDSNNKRRELREFEKTTRDSKALRELLKTIVCLKDTKDKEIKPINDNMFVDVYWPVPCLHESIIIVDTPGIGPDFPELTERLFEYLPKALAFIYVLNTPNAGGVQKDRILKIHDELARKSLKDQDKQFDPKRAIFICNKWDQIHEDPDDVFSAVKSLLKDNWTGFQQDRLFKLSARQEILASSRGKSMSADFKAILKGIEDMIPASIEEKVRRHLRWQENFINRMFVNLKGRIRNTLKSGEEKLTMVQKIEKRISIAKPTQVKLWIIFTRVQKKSVKN